MENWKRYCSTLSESNTIATTSMNHVNLAKQELDKFEDGKLKEWHPDAWPHIAEYWASIGKEWLVKSTLNGNYKNKDPKTGERRLEIFHWSAAFIQYCMKSNEQFQKLSWGKNKGIHRYYWKSAVKNTNKLLRGEDIEEDEWIYLSEKVLRKVDYEPVVGDIAMQRNPAGLHGDIVTEKGRIGGNLSHSVRIETEKPIVGIVTQNPEAKMTVLKLIEK